MTDTDTDTDRVAPTAPGRRSVRRWWTIAAVATIGVLLVGEIGLRVGGSKLGEPLVWYSRTAQDKVDVIEAPDQADAPVVFIGSSAVNASLDPGRFREKDTCGRRAYNAASNGAVPSLTADFLRRVVIPNLHPKIVVLGISPRDFATSSATTADLYFSSAAVRNDLGGRADRWFSSWSYLVRYRTMIRSPRILKARFDELRGADTGFHYDADGFEAADNADQTDTATQTNDPGLAIDRGEVQALDRLVGKLQREGITPVLVALGTSERWNSTPRGAALSKDAHAALDKIAADRDAELLDMSDVDDPKQFVDLVHTNVRGTEIETDRVVEALADHREGC